MAEAMELDRINELSVQIHANAAVITDHFNDFFATVYHGGEEGRIAAQVIAGVSRDAPGLLEDQVESLAKLLEETEDYQIEGALLATFEQLSYHDRHAPIDASTPIAAAAVPEPERPTDNVQRAINLVLRLVRAGHPLSSTEMNHVTATLDSAADENVAQAIETFEVTVKEDHPGCNAALSILVGRLSEQLVNVDRTQTSGITW